MKASYKFLHLRISEKENFSIIMAGSQHITVNDGKKISLHDQVPI